MPNNRGIYIGLLDAGRYFAEKLRQNVSTADYPSDIEKAISVGSPNVSSLSNAYIEVKIDLSEDAAPMAAAFEWGSGEHAERGPRPYQIRPKDAPKLAFDWTPEQIPWASPKFGGVIREEGQRTKGIYFFHWVDHPGIEARPYIRPTLEQTKGEIREILGRAFVAQLTFGRQKTIVIG